MATSRRGYPILGPLKLKLIDGSINPLKPVYLSYKILRGRSQDQLQGSEAGPEAGPGAGPGASPGPGSAPGSSPGSQISQILVYLRLNPSQTAVSTD